MGAERTGAYVGQFRDSLVSLQGYLAVAFGVAHVFQLEKAERRPTMRVPGLLDDMEFKQVSSDYSIHSIQQRLLDASRRAEVLLRSRVPDPNPLDSKEYLNRYEFPQTRPIVLREGRPELTALEFVVNSIDFSFVRHVSAVYYKMPNEQPIHDPPNLYLIHLWLTASGLWHKEAIELLRHKRRGREARKLLHLELDEVPKTYTVLTRFLERLGDEGLWKVSKTFFWILVEADFFPGSVYLAGDSQLIPTFSRYRGCNSFQPECARLSVKRSEVADALTRSLDKSIHQWKPSQEEPVPKQRFIVSLPCPFGATTGKNKRPLEMRIGYLRLFDNNAPTAGTDETSKWGLKNDFLREHHLGLRFEDSRPVHAGLGKYHLSCPHFPSDPTARIGWKNSNQPDGDPIPVFGADVESLTFLVPQLGLALPFGALGAPGNAPSRLPALLSILDDTDHKVRPLTASLDARYDTFATYKVLRAREISPIIKLVHHKDEDSPESTAKRGITIEGVPLARCGVEMKANGFDYSAKRRSFLCGFQKSPEVCAACPFGPDHTKHGQVTKVSVNKQPRYVNDIARNSPHWSEAYALRTASERANADVAGRVPTAIGRPRLRGVTKITAKAILAIQFLLWSRIFTFISDVEHLNALSGGLHSAVDKAVLLDNAATLHQLPDSLVTGLLPSPFG